MTANRFATILYRNTSKITFILIYALLEWILIVLLLFNSLFSYLITKFAQCFGLKSPCIWCAKPDHIFEPAAKNIHRNLFCEIHAKEISKLGFCSNHQKLSEFGEMCEDRSSSGPESTLKCAHKRNLISEEDHHHHHIEEAYDFDKKIPDFATDSFNKADDHGPLEAEIDEIVTVERLKSVLRAEQKALQALYSELEEERSDSAVAANQMIDQLQEEKEKQELEKELQGVRQKVFDYEDRDELSVDLNRDAKEEEEEGFYSNQECSKSRTRVDEVLDKEESLAEFEEERLSILVQLKVLEEKLVSLEHEEERRFDGSGSKPVEDENTCYSDESNGHLLQEILQHLHDLRDVEILEENLSDIGANMK